jgi:hypothetical protein
MQELAQLTVDFAACQNVTSSPAAPNSLVPFPKDSRTVTNAPIPSVVAMLICDQVIAEQGTNKKSLIGVFEIFNALVFPTMIPRIAI